MPRIRVPFNQYVRLRLDEYDLYCLQAGSFATVNVRNGIWSARLWYHCREQFQGNSARIKRLLFCHHSELGVGYSVATFLYRIERMLKLGKTEFGFSMCGPTKHVKVMWIEPSKWWLCKPMRRSFFTAILRAGQKYNIQINNFESALWSNRYLRQSQYAVKRFLKGYTEYTGNEVGWNRQFFWGTGYCRPNPPSQKEVNSLLIKPKQNLCCENHR